jgi:hypothetical protein
MKINYLFPNSFKRIGWLMFIPGVILGIISLFFNYEPNFLSTTVFAIANEPIMSNTKFFTLTNNNIANEIIALLVIISGLFIAFSKQKAEDEFIAKIRLESLVWASYINYIILVLSIIFVYEMAFYWILILNMFTILIFFIVRFNWALYQFKNQTSNEE